MSRTSPAAALSQNARLGLFAFLAVASWYVISDFVDTNPTQYGTRIDPMMHSPHTMNSESDSNSNDDKDLNGQDVPKEGEQKGDGNGKPTKTERMQQKKGKSSADSQYGAGAEHKSNARGSTINTHEKGRARNARGKGSEKADIEHKIQKNENNYNNEHTRIYK